jgi:hypothetical protein
MKVGHWYEAEYDYGNYGNTWKFEVLDLSTQGTQVRYLDGTQERFTHHGLVALREIDAPFRFEDGNILCDGTGGEDEPEDYWVRVNGHWYRIANDILSWLTDEDMAEMLNEESPDECRLVPVAKLEADYYS